MKAQATIMRRIGIGLVALCATMLTASCATGQHASTANNIPAIDGTDGSVGKIDLRAVAIKSPDEACYLPGSNAAMTLVIVNSGTTPDTLTGVSSPRFGSAVVAANAAEATTYLQSASGSGSCAAAPSGSNTPSAAPQASGSLPAPAPNPALTAGRALQLGLTDTGTDTSALPVIVLEDLQGNALYPGESIPVTFNFGAAGEITLTVPVQLSATANQATVPPVAVSPAEPSSGPAE